MRSGWRAVALALLLAVVCGLKARADTVVVAANAQSPAAGHDEASSLQWIHVRNEGDGRESRGFLRFDFSSLPRATQLDKATLRLWASDVDRAGTIAIAPILEAWSEKGLSEETEPVFGSPVATFSVVRASQGHFVIVDITGLVRDWLSGAEVNNGLALVGSGGHAVDAKFDTKENVLTSHAPEIEVAFAGTPGPAGPAGPSGPRGPAGPPIDSLNALAGVACSRGVETGAVAVQVAADGSVSLRCVFGTSTTCTDPTQCCADLDGDGVCDQVPCDGGLAIADGNPKDAARALAICGLATPTTGFGLVDAAFTRADGTAVQATNQFGILPGFGPNVPPREGASLFVLSSGRARIPGQTGACGSPSCFGTGLGTAPPGFPQQTPGCPGSNVIDDDVGLKLTLRAPANATGFSFIFNFYTFEFPDFVCSQFNDQFVVIMDPPPPGSTNGNIVFDALRNPVSVNSAFFAVCDPTVPQQPFHPTPCPLGAAQLAGTGFDTWAAKPAAATGWLQTTVPVQGGQVFTLRFLIWDGGDQNDDSTVLLDDFRWLVGPIAPGTTPR